MAATARQERELKEKYQKQLNRNDLSPLELLRAYVLSQGVTGIKTLATCFKRIDKNGDRRIDFKEFQQGLKQDGIIVEENLERECFDEMDTDKTGELSFDEFLVALRVTF